MKEGSPISTSIDVQVALDTGADLEGARIVGSIYPADSAGQGVRNVPFPCGLDVMPLNYPVAPGRYLVQATLPSGVVLTGDVEAREGASTLVILSATDSPYESHSWQYLVGNVEQSSAYHNESRAPSVRSAPPRTGSHGPLTAWLTEPRRGAWSFEWTLSLLQGGGRRGFRDALVGRRTSRVSPEHRDAISSLYRFASDGNFGDYELNLVVGDPSEWHVTRPPLSWDRALVEVLVNDRQSPTGSTVAMAVRDRRVGAGLAYMAQGALDAAARLFVDAESMLYRKMINPLAAAAGGYVLVGTDLTDERRRWDQWLFNLHGRFPWMSDGTVLCAARQLRLATTEPQLDRARRYFLEACDRGVPHYTLGLSWLIDGLTEFPDDPECVRRLRQARALSWRVDMREPFVIVRVGEV